MLVARREILEALLNDPEWSDRLKTVKTTEEFHKLVVEYAKTKGHKVGFVKLKPKKKAKQG